VSDFALFFTMSWLSLENDFETGRSSIVSIHVQFATHNHSSISFNANILRSYNTESYRGRGKGCRLDSPGSARVSPVDYYGHGSEPPDFIKGGKLFDGLRNICFSRKIAVGTSLRSKSVR
jgi:hypothetical protein